MAMHSKNYSLSITRCSSTSSKKRKPSPRPHSRDSRREEARGTRAEPYYTRKYNRHTESKYSPKYLSKKEETEREDSRHLPDVDRSEMYRNRGDGNRRLRRISRDRSRSRSRGRILHEENYDGRESHRGIGPLPDIRDLVYLQNARRPPLAVVVPHPPRILLQPRLVPRAPHMRVPFPARVRPVFLAPVVIFREPIMPLRPRIQPYSTICN